MEEGSWMIGWKGLKKKMRINETCKNCREKFDSGIWLSPQFSDEKVLLFCSKKCKIDYLKGKLGR